MAVADKRAATMAVLQIFIRIESLFGPFRIDIARALLKQPGDDTKLFTFNVGTQF